LNSPTPTKEPFTHAAGAQGARILSVKLVLVSLFWGGTYTAGKVVGTALPSLPAAFARFGVAAVLLVLIAHWREGGLPRLNRAQLGHSAVLGVLGVFLYNAFFFQALTLIPAGRTALFVSLGPIVTALISSIFYRERLGKAGWAGVMLALSGAVILVTRGDLSSVFLNPSGSFGAGELYICAAVVCWSAYTLYSRKLLKQISALAATTYASLWGVLFLGIASWGEVGTLDLSTVGWAVWAAVLYLGVLGTVVAYVWYYEGVRELGPSKASVFTNLVPLFGVAVSALLLGEPILVSMVLGGVMTVIGVTITTRR
jgi:drug/metabolite transporter (DMT)-like permease